MHSFLQLKTLRRIPWGIPLFYAQNGTGALLLMAPFRTMALCRCRHKQDCGAGFEPARRFNQRRDAENPP
jgi:hypothetical protein